MKRYQNLYSTICNIQNITKAYNEVCKNTRNKSRVENLKSYKNIYITRIQKILHTKSYKVGPYNKFTIYEPKERHIVSQNLEDKTVNHLVARYILYPAILPCLIDTNVASRKSLGTHSGLQFATNFHNICKQKYGTYKTILIIT